MGTVLELNKYMAVGRLTKQPEVKKTNGSGVSVLNFSIAINRRFKRGNDWVKEPVYIDCEAWDTGAEAIARNFEKGEKIYVEGEFKQEQYTTKDGEQRKSLRLRVFQFNKVELPDDEGEGRGERQPANAGAASSRQTKAGGRESVPDDFSESGDVDEIPF